MIHGKECVDAAAQWHRTQRTIQSDCNGKRRLFEHKRKYEGVFAGLHISMALNSCLNLASKNVLSEVDL